MADLPFVSIKPFKNQALKQMAVPMLGLSLLAGCSSIGKDQVACPELKAMKGFEYVTSTGATLGQDVTIRVNGVDTACYDAEDGHRMDIDLGLMIKRPDDDIQKIEQVDVDVTFAFLNDQGEVIGREIISDEVFIGSYSSKSRPVLSFGIDVPAGSRVVFGLGRATE